METYIAYIYDKTGKNIAQIFDIEDIFVTEELNKPSELKFSVFNDNFYAKKDILREYMFVKVVKLKNQKEKTLIEGFIDKIETDIYKNIVFVKDYFGLWDRIIFDTNFHASFVCNYFCSSGVQKVNDFFRLNLTYELFLEKTRILKMKFPIGDDYMTGINETLKLGYEIKCVGKKNYFCG